eukprot:3482584-Pleurochrysis_carterae.AAC.2
MYLLHPRCRADLRVLALKVVGNADFAATFGVKEDALCGEPAVRGEKKRAFDTLLRVWTLLICVCV